MDAFAADNQSYLKRRVLRWAVFALIFANLFVWLAASVGSRRDYLEVSYFDVGQGDAAFVQAPGGAQILIDGGPDRAVLEKLGNRMPFYDRDIDWVILSHPDRDHLSGLLSVLKNYRVKNILWSGIEKESAQNSEWLGLIASEGANIIIGEAGDIFDLGGQPQLTLKIMAPDPNASAADDSNGSSIVVSLVYGTRSFLFTGDADNEAEQNINQNFPNLQADVLKVAHHGSKYSADEEFLADLLPAAAVISVGKGNSYGHPADTVLEMLAKYDIKTLRTDQNGDIVFRTDGNVIFVKTEK